MGSWSSLSINEYQIDTTKSYINPFMALLFRESDRRIRRVHYSKYYAEPNYHGTEEISLIEYVIKKSILKDRLELLGFDLNRSIQSYDILLEKEITNFFELKLEKSYAFKHLQNLKQIGFDGWIIIIREILVSGWNTYDLKNYKYWKEDDTFSFILDDINYNNKILGYPSLDFGLALRGLVEAFNDDDELILEISSLIWGGCYSEDEDVMKTTINNQLYSAFPYQKILILTEGSTDAMVLSRSLKLLYPHLEEYFAFLDFSGARPDGGASALEKTVKAFAAASINHRIIALFDNDATGLGTLNSLRKTSLPDNITLLSLPDLEFAKSYPTIGPHGLVNGNINGKACSIELYLGPNLLKDESGTFIPVHYSNYDSRPKDYQGEIMQKALIFKRFETIISKIEKDNSLLDRHQWDDIKLIFANIFDTVSKYNAMHFNGEYLQFPQSREDYFP